MPLALVLSLRWTTRTRSHLGSLAWTHCCSHIIPGDFVKSIAAAGDDDDDDAMDVEAPVKRRQFTAPAAAMREIANAGDEEDPFADTRAGRIADRESEYHVSTSLPLPIAFLLILAFSLL